MLADEQQHLQNCVGMNFTQVKNRLDSKILKLGIGVNDPMKNSLVC